MKITDIRQLSLSELSKEIDKARQELLKLKLQAGSADFRETHKFKTTRKLIAQLQTVKHALSKSAN